MQGGLGAGAARGQVPKRGELTLDHLAHFVPDAEGASDALTRLGFTLTPFSEQSHRLRDDGPLVPAGTASRLPTAASRANWIVAKRSERAGSANCPAV